jgi:hypothetical protein
MNKSLQIESRVGVDGVLSLRVPLAGSDANTEVIVTISPKLKSTDWPQGYFEQTFGCLAADPLLIPDDRQP